MNKPIYSIAESVEEDAVRAIRSISAINPSSVMRAPAEGESKEHLTLEHGHAIFVVCTGANSYSKTQYRTSQKHMRLMAFILGERRSGKGGVQQITEQVEEALSAYPFESFEKSPVRAETDPDVTDFSISDANGGSKTVKLYAGFVVMELTTQYPHAIKK